MPSLLSRYIRIFHLMCRFIGLIFMYVFEKHRVLKRVILVLYNIFIRDLSKDTPRKICIFAPDVKLFLDHLISHW